MVEAGTPTRKFRPQTFVVVTSVISKSRPLYYYKNLAKTEDIKDVKAACFALKIKSRSTHSGDRKKMKESCKFD